MIRVVLYVAALIVAVLVAVWFANNPGDVTVVWRGWRIDTSVGILLLLIMLTVLIMLAIAKVIAVIRGTAKGIASARRERRITQGINALGYGFAAAHAGQPAAARRYAKEASALLNGNAATHMLQAQAAHVNDDAAGLRNVALSLLEQPETELAALRDLALRAQHEGDVVGALNYAKRAVARRDAPRWAIEMVLDLDIAQSRWNDALHVLESKAAKDQYSAEDYKKLKAAVLTASAEQTLAQGDAKLAESQSKKAMDLGGGERALVTHARALFLQGNNRGSVRDVEKAWKTHPSPTLIRAYMELVADEPPLEQARRVEKLIADTADHPESRLALSEVSLRAKLWGQARNRLSPLLGDDVPQDLHARAAILMAELETAERNDPAAGALWLKRALDRTTPAAIAAATPKSVSDILR
jgi:HemY protein